MLASNFCFGSRFGPTPRLPSQATFPNFASQILQQVLSPCLASSQHMLDMELPAVGQMLRTEFAWLACLFQTPTATLSWASKCWPPKRFQFFTQVYSSLMNWWTDNTFWVINESCLRCISLVNFQITSKKCNLMWTQLRLILFCQGFWLAADLWNFSAGPNHDWWSDGSVHPSFGCPWVPQSSLVRYIC